MKRFFTKVGRFFWSWGFLKFVLWTITLIVFFYVEEDWRGARAWAATKAKWEAKGETFDFAKLIPPPVPDDQNLAALPLFKMEPDPKNKGNLELLTLQRAFRVNQPGSDLPTGVSGGPQKGQLPEMGKIREDIALTYAEAFKTAPAIKDTLDQFEALYPFIADVRSAAAARPFCRFEQTNFDRLHINLLTSQIGIARFLALHAILALDVHKPDLALEDIQTNFRIAAGLREQPMLASGLCAIAVTAINFSAVYDGIACRSWNDAQLADLQKELAKIDYLSNYQQALRGEAVMAISAFDSLKSHRPAYGSQLNARNASDESKLKASDGFRSLWADGWIDWMKVHAADFDLNAVRFVDPKTRRVSLKTVDQFAAEIARRQPGWNAQRLWTILSDAAAGPIVAMAQHFAEGQVYVDEARIACALERYRLAHGMYPASLDGLAPSCIDAVPHDIMNGEPYRYKLRPDGTYLLYSVGWNQTDEGGKVVYRKDVPRAIDYEKGDWVWFGPK